MRLQPDCRYMDVAILGRLWLVMVGLRHLRIPPNVAAVLLPVDPDSPTDPANHRGVRVLLSVPKAVG